MYPSCGRRVCGLDLPFTASMHGRMGTAHAQDCDLEVIRRLFAEITAILEEAHAVSVEGQAAGEDWRRTERQAAQLGGLFDDASRIGIAIATISRRKP